MRATGPHDPASDEGDAAFRHEARRLGVTWLALLVLMGLSLGSAFLALGSGNFAVSLAIAAVKASLVVWIFMQLNLAPPVTRLAALAGLLFLALLSGLSGVDYATRRATPAPWQMPQQVAPTFGQAPTR